MAGLCETRAACLQGGAKQAAGWTIGQGQLAEPPPLIPAMTSPARIGQIAELCVAAGQQVGTEPLSAL